MAIDKKSIIPLYYQLANILREQINTKEIKPGEPLPPESSLITKYNVSRGTVRQAFSVLTHEGLIERFPGKGSFVTYPKMIQNANKDMGFFTKAIERMGKIPTAKVVEFNDNVKTNYSRNKLKLKNHEPAVFIKRLRFVNDEPWAIENSYFIKEIGDKILKDGADKSLYKLLQEKYNYLFDKSENTIECSIADAQVAKSLEIVKGSPILLVERTMFLTDGTLFEFSKDICRGDRIRFSVNDLYQVNESPTFQIAS